MKGKIKNIIISILLLVCCCFTLVGCANDSGTVLDLARENGLNCIKSAKEYNINSGNANQSQTSNPTTINVTNNNSSINLSEVFATLKENGYTGDFSSFLNDYVFKDHSSVTETEYSTNKNLFSVVSVYSEFRTYQYINNPLGSLQKTPYTQISAGSGVVYKTDKTDGSTYIITNFHVIYASNEITGNYTYTKSDEGDGCIATNIYCFMYGNVGSLNKTTSTDENGYTIYTPNQNAIKCEYVGGSASYDIAVLKVADESKNLVKNSKLCAVDIKHSNEITVGEKAVAIGNPASSGLSATSGIISVDSEYIDMTSAKNTTIKIRVIRTDAPVNGGNSGGGLFDSAGKLIGIVNAKLVSSQIDNIGYAIPADIAVGVAENIIKYCDSENKNLQKITLGIAVKSIYSSAVYDGTRAKVLETVAIEKVDQTSPLAGKITENTIVKKITISSFNAEGNETTKSINIERLYSIVDASFQFNVGDILKFSIYDTNGNKLDDVKLTLTSDLLATIE